MFHFVLVEPAVPENVGAAARALKTMGFSSLWIVNSDAHRQKPARILAHGAGEVLEQAQVFNSLEQVREKVDLIGSSAKPRHQRDILLAPDALRELLQDKGGGEAEIALAFGREESGLHGPEIALCDLLTSIPLAVSYPSLNLGQAVMLYAYALQQTGAAPLEHQQAPDQLRVLQAKCQCLLNLTGYASDEKLYHWLMERLPLLSTRDTGFAHHLVDKLTKKIMQNQAD